MKWTRKVPTVEGWYWVTQSHGHERVWGHDIMWATPNHAGVLCWHDADDPDPPVTEYHQASMMYAGPIPKPEE